VVEGEAGDVGLAGFVPNLALARGGGAIDAAVVAGGDEEGTVGGGGECPDVGRLRVEILGGLAVLNLPDFAVGGSGGIQGAFGVEGEGEDAGVGGGPENFGLLPGADAIDAAAVASAEVEGTVGAATAAKMPASPEEKISSRRGARVRRPSRVRETPWKRPFTKSE
jgi:hypothetical protein